MLQAADLLYRLGDEIATWMESRGVDEGDCDVWHGYWSGVATAGLSSGKERTSGFARRLGAAVRMAAYYVNQAGKR